MVLIGPNPIEVQNECSQEENVRVEVYMWVVNLFSCGDYLPIPSPTRYTKVHRVGGMCVCMYLWASFFPPIPFWGAFLLLEVYFPLLFLRSSPSLLRFYFPKPPLRITPSSKKVYKILVFIYQKLSLSLGCTIPCNQKVCHPQLPPFFRFPPLMAYQSSFSTCLPSATLLSPSFWWSLNPSYFFLFKVNVGLPLHQGQNFPFFHQHW